MKLNAKQLRGYQQSNIGDKSSDFRLQSADKKEVYIILDNVLDTFNVGSIFRLADAVAARKVYLCGGTETPPNPRIKKASINTTEIVDWEYVETAVEAIRKVRALLTAVPRSDHPRTPSQRGWSGVQVIAIEQVETSVPYNKYAYRSPLALVVGNESYGILPETVKECDAAVEIPMRGTNISLNVTVSLAVVLYKALDQVDPVEQTTDG